MSQKNSISSETVRKIAKLARIDVPVGDITHLAAELSGILSWIEQLDTVCTDHILPFLNPTAHTSSITPYRADVITDGDIRPEILKNAPDVSLDMFVVPKVID